MTTCAECGSQVGPTSFGCLPWFCDRCMRAWAVPVDLTPIERVERERLLALLDRWYRGEDLHPRQLANDASNRAGSW